MLRMAALTLFVLFSTLCDLPPSSQPAANILSTSVSASLAGLSTIAGLGGSSDAKNERLQDSGRLAIVRYVDGEFVHVVKPLPASREGFTIEVGKPIDEHQLKQQLANQGSAANPGDVVRITKVDFGSKEISIEINGGTHGHFRLRDHLQVGMAGPVPTATTTSTTGAAQVKGAMLVLDYGRPVPDVSPDDVKQALAAFLDFTKERSAATNWVETLPPEYRDAIAQKKAIVGMNHDMVLAAMGRPWKKVRERQPDGDETEDWIYGTPPARTTFVTFIGDKVVKVEQFN